MPAKKKQVSEKQLAANRRNSQKSTGPRTPEGKQRASQNSWRHGLAAAHSVIALEDRPDFEEFRAALIDEHRPVGTQELLLVTQIANAFWRIQRIQLATVGEYDRAIDEDESATPGMTIANTMVQRTHAFDLLRRYEATANSVYFRSLTMLERLQSRRRKQETDQRVSPKNGFVSQSNISVHQRSSAAENDPIRVNPCPSVAESPNERPGT